MSIGKTPLFLVADFLERPCREANLRVWGALLRATAEANRVTTASRGRYSTCGEVLFKVTELPSNRIVVTVLMPGFQITHCAYFANSGRPSNNSVTHFPTVNDRTIAHQNKQHDLLLA